MLRGGGGRAWTHSPPRRGSPLRQGNYAPERSLAAREGRTSSTSGSPLRCACSPARLRPLIAAGRQRVAPRNDRQCQPL